MTRTVKRHIKGRVENLAVPLLCLKYSLYSWNISHSLINFWHPNELKTAQRPFSSEKVDKPIGHVLDENNKNCRKQSTKLPIKAIVTTGSEKQNMNK